MTKRQNIGYHLLNELNYKVTSFNSAYFEQPENELKRTKRIMMLIKTALFFLHNYYLGEFPVKRFKNLKNLTVSTIYRSLIDI